jgi:hypothetical protein
MARRIDLELTSRRDDGSWTWRAAGAREPRGTLDASVLPEGAEVGDVLRADAEFTVDGIAVVATHAPKAPKAPRSETLELIGSRRAEPLVTSNLTSKKGGRDREDRGARGGRSGRRGERGDRSSRPGTAKGQHGARRAGGREGGQRQGAGRPDKEREGRPAAKRLRAGRGHRNRALRDLPEEQRPLAELVLRGGVPAVRQAVDRQHSLAEAEQQPKLRGEVLVSLAERLAPRLKAAEWRDRVDAALRQVDAVDLRDLRSVVSAAEHTARDEESRALAEELRQALAARVEREHQAWLDELTLMVREGRIVRALRLSSRPPKAGAPLPPELAAGLAEQATAGLSAEVSQERFATLLEAVSFSPVHQRVAATSIPREPSDTLLASVRKMASRVPAVAAQFGVAVSS